MHREVFKSILLGALVLASVTMTFNILFYKSDFENYNPNSTKRVAIAQARNIPEVIRPNLMLEHNSNGEFGQNSTNQIQRVYTLLRQSIFRESTNYTIGQGTNNNPHYTLVFPAPLTIDALSKVFSFDDNDKSLTRSKLLIDRVEVFSSPNGRNVNAVFYSPDERSKLYTTVDHLNMNNLKGLYVDTNLHPYDRQALNGKIVYLPDNKTYMYSEISYYQRLSLEEFIPILFTDPDNVFPSRGKTEYTDSERQMERTNNVIQFVNPGITSSSGQKQDPIIGSIEWMNNFKIWTDNYIYQGVSLKNSRGDGTATFRMTLGNYMVFNTETYPNWYLSLIELSWKSGELSNYRGTLLDLNPVGGQGRIALDSGKEILDQLSSNTNVQVKKIEDLTIGYELKNPTSDSDQSISATPDWFYKIGGRWYSVTSALMNARGINSGKETPS
ncbi:YycH family regulatory protein [Sporolactobacillus kofuensis]|uniref:YycH family regulatory protein n=1 Tax=Sporolactobacillus kofuensis TaxID=269672 RepID=A0ABW1WBN7_9BACL|nr:two-component system activity regulator YycH [Sporolactobacillus kofuensis]MCO7175242.1 two-component system activity regulator YycH [Sporolactobacillus kofuensis]